MQFSTLTNIPIIFFIAFLDLKKVIGDVCLITCSLNNSMSIIFIVATYIMQNALASTKEMNGAKYVFRFFVLRIHDCMNSVNHVNVTTVPCACCIFRP